jgi:hypothetical protein
MAARQITITFCLVTIVVLPVLGAVPDGMIVLFSGMGPNAQEGLTVGVGALAGRYKHW